MEEKGMYSIPFEKRPKQLATIRAAERWKALNGGEIFPTVEELSKTLNETQGCVYERVKKLRKAGIIITRLVDDRERVERSLRSRRAR